MVRNVAMGLYTPFVSRGVVFGDQGKSESVGTSYQYWPVLIREEGSVYWDLLGQFSFMTDEYRLNWSLRDLLNMKHSSAMISVISKEDGRMLWQNSASMDLYGCLGTLNSEIDSERVNPQAGVSRHNFIELIFGPETSAPEEFDSQVAQMRTTTASGGQFRATLEVLHASLRELLSLSEDQEMHLDS